MSSSCVERRPSAWSLIPSKRVRFWATVVACLTWAAASSAQTASDKATARQMATEGIQSYKQGKHAEALDLLQRAEQLYDAPVHLIYIARVQTALGKLVEASETYRRLVRTDLAAGAPQAFKDAVTDAQKELQQLESKIPSLRINVGPADTKGLQLKLDGELLSSVVIGINRPTNPGRHSIEAAAAGFDNAAATVDLAVGGKQTVTLQMRPRPGAPAPALPASQGTTSVTAPEAATASSQLTSPAVSGVALPTADKSEKPFDKPPQILLGIRWAGVLPGGKLRLGGNDPASIGINGGTTNNPNTEAKLSDRYGFGNGVELIAGYRLPMGKQFALTPALAFDVYWFNKGTYYALPIGQIIQGYADAQGPGLSSVLQVTPTARSVLLGATIEFPRAEHSWSPTYYAELFFLIFHELKATGTVATGGDTCKFSDQYTGTGVRLGAGALLPASKFLRMSAGIGISVASASSRIYSDNCARNVGTNSSGIASTTVDTSADNKLHTIAGLNLGGDFLIGL